MSVREQILGDFMAVSMADIVKAVGDGIVSVDELQQAVKSYSPVRRHKAVPRLTEVKAWLAAQEANTEEAYDRFLSEFPGSSLSEMAETAKTDLRRAEELQAWQIAQEANTEEAYERFLSKYPGSSLAGQAEMAIKQLLEAKEQAKRDAVWNSVDKKDAGALRCFISEHPDDPHCDEARQMLNAIQEIDILGSDMTALTARINAIRTDPTVIDPDMVISEEIEKWLKNEKISVSVYDLLDKIEEDRNFLGASVLKKLIYKGLLSYSDLTGRGIRREFIVPLAQGINRQKFSSPRPLEKIKKTCTEVYFWGFPSSGKSCALGAILSVARRGRVARSMELDSDCQGYAYMTQLASLFSGNGKVGILPAGTPTTSTYEMGFDLEDEKGRIHPITCIDLAGELVRCMYKSDAGLMMDDEETRALETLTRILIDNRTVNRKIHIFVLEYGGEERLYEGHDQEFYLQSALTYINRTKIFEKDTDAIYLMLTKVDKTGLVGKELVDTLAKYIEDNYNGFYQGLESICRRNKINDGKVWRIPFSLGEVCFQNYCVFNEIPAANVVRELLIRTKAPGKSKLKE